MLLSKEQLEALRGQLVVSAQAYPGEPMRHPQTMAQVAASAVIGGAAAIRVQGLADIQFTRSAVEVPVIGLFKDGHEGVFITPTVHHALAVAQSGAHIVALDGTRRERPDGRSLAQTIKAVHELSGALVMADCGSLDDALAAAEAGADLVGTTLVAEGRIHTPAQARLALEAGAFAVVVGTAITHPATITSWFSDALGGGS